MLSKSSLGAILNDVTRRSDFQAGGQPNIVGWFAFGLVTFLLAQQK